MKVLLMLQQHSNSLNVVKVERVCVINLSKTISGWVRDKTTFNEPSPDRSLVYYGCSCQLICQLNSKREWITLVFCCQGRHKFWVLWWCCRVVKKHQRLLISLLRFADKKRKYRGGNGVVTRSVASTFLDSPFT